MRHASLPLACRPLTCLLLAGLVVGAVAECARGATFQADRTVVYATLDNYGRNSDCWGFVGTDSREYIIQCVNTGTVWHDVQDPAQPVEVAYIPGPTSNWRDAFVIGNHAYVGTEGGGGIQIIDLTNPAAPFLVATYTTTVGNAHNVFGDPSRNLLFVIGGGTTSQGPLQVLDVSSPTAPVQIASYSGGGYVHDMSVEDNLVHLNHIYAGTVSVVDLTNPATPVPLGTFVDPAGSNHSSWPVGDGTHLLIAHEKSAGDVRMLDISNPAAISLVSTFNPYGTEIPHNPHIVGPLAFVAWNRTGVRILDVSSPSALTEVGALDTSPAADDTGGFSGCWGVYPHLPSGLVAATDRERGLFLFRYEPNAGVVRGTVVSAAGHSLLSTVVSHDDFAIVEAPAASGTFEFSVPPGLQTLRASAYAHAPESLTVNVAASDTVDIQFTLSVGAGSALSGTVRDLDTGAPLEDVTVSLTGEPTAPVATGPDGSYIFPLVAAGTRQVAAHRYGYEVPADFPTKVLDGTPSVKDMRLRPAAVSVDFNFPGAPTWTTSTTGTAGLWEFASPTETVLNNAPFQTGTDHGVGADNRCAVTGASGTTANDNDVDGGTTSLVSPVYDLSGMAQPQVFYYRWFATSGTFVDSFTTLLSSDGGTSWPIQLETTTTSEPFWQLRAFDLAAELSTFTQVRFRFDVSDVIIDDAVEGAVDDFTIYDAAPGPVGATLPPPGLAESLSPPRPNPFVDRTEIRFSLARRSSVDLGVFDVRGRRLATIRDGVLPAGSHRAAWDGRDDRGRRVATGVYFYRLKTDRAAHTQKVVRLR